jgi:gamma-glutamyltranspeptidase / glutathione hydrolase
MAHAKWIPRTTRPVIMGTRYMVSAGHYLAAAAGVRILEQGGNAIDAGVATGLCINVLQADLTNLGGVAPICVYRADTGRVETISGLGWWPAAADPEVFRRQYGGRIRRGIHRCVLPAALDAWLTALSRHGTMTLADVAAPAIDLAEHGFPMHSVMRDTMTEPSALAAMRSWPSTRSVFLDDRGEPPAVGAPVIQHDLARTLTLLVDAERGAATREDGVARARARFYEGDIADAIADFMAAEGGWVTRADLAGFHVEVEPALRTSYRGHDVFACGPWCQGPVVLEALNVLEGWDLAAAGPGSADAYHLVVEALKAAFADRDRYYGDPRHVAVPVDGLLAKAYAERWRARIDVRRASPGMPEPGDAWAFSEGEEPEPSRWRMPAPTRGEVDPDTSYLCVVDEDGNAFSATPSDGATSGPLVPGLGFIVSSRGMQSWLDPDHPACLAPGKRPRLTPNPGMVLKDGRLAMPYGTPGNDVQPQAMVQFLVNVLDHGMDVQEAVEAPRCATYSFPRSSDPHPYSPGRLDLEARAGEEVIRALRERGHDAHAWPEWTGTAGSLGAIRVDHRHGVLHGAADPRRVAYAIGR